MVLHSYYCMPSKDYLFICMYIIIHFHPTHRTSAAGASTCSGLRGRHPSVAHEAGGCPERLVLQGDFRSALQGSCPDQVSDSAYCREEPDHLPAFPRSDGRGGVAHLPLVKLHRGGTHTRGVVIVSSNTIPSCCFSDCISYFITTFVVLAILTKIHLTNSIKSRKKLLSV